MITDASERPTETHFGSPPTNEQLAEKLATVSDLLLAQGANRFRADAYRRAAEVIGNLEGQVWRIYGAGGLAGLEGIESVGRTISRALQQMIRGGRWPLMERLQGNDVAEHAFASVPNIGEKLAKRIHDELGIETLAELQAAAWDGRLAKMQGIGEKRIRAVRESLAARGRRADSRDSGEGAFQSQLFDGHVDLTEEIPVAELLDIDNEYRFKSARGLLPKTAPRKLNPQHDFWLPILHTQRDERHFTALYSNTERAHAMGATHDWVVVYFEDHDNEGSTAVGQSLRPISAN